MFHLPGVEKINAFEFVFDKGIDADIALLGRFSKEVIRYKSRNPADLIEIENHLNQMEKISSLFENPIEDIKEENISIGNNIEQRIEIPDAEFRFHTNSSESLQSGFNRSNQNQQRGDFVIRDNESQNQSERQRERNNPRVDEIEEIIIT